MNTANRDGIILPESFAGTYSVGSTCIFNTNFTLYGFQGEVVTRTLTAVH